MKRNRVDQDGLAAADPGTPPKAPGREGVISMWCLGRLGKFGNQLFQYAFLALYADRYGLRIETPRWVGQKIYGFKDPKPSRHRAPVVDTWISRYAKRREFGVFALLNLLRWMQEAWPDDIPWVEFDEHVLSAEQPAFVDAELWGTFLYPTRAYRPYKSEFRALFTPLPGVAERLRPMLDRLKREYRTLVAIQIRQGDFWQYADCDWAFIAPTRWYVEWLESIWDDLDAPVLLVCSDQLGNVLDDFAKFNPVTTTALDPAVCQEMDEAGFGFFPDFYLLSHCDLMGISGSSFALAPAMLNEACQGFYRPDPAAQRLVAFDPWDTRIYNDEADSSGLESLAGRVRYRWKNLRLMAKAHGGSTLVRQTIPRLHRRLSYELGALLASAFMQAMRLVNHGTSKAFGRKVSPLDVFKTDGPIRFFTRKFNR